MIDFIVDYGVSIGLVIIAFAIIIFAYLNNKKAKIQAPPQTKKPPKQLHPKKLLDGLKTLIGYLSIPEELFKLVTGVIAVVLLFCGAQASATIEDVRAGQKSICEMIGKSEERLNKCLEDNSKTMINKLEDLLRIEGPNDVK